MILRLRSALLALALGATLPVRAESPSTNAPAPTRTPSPILAILDADHNGTLSAAELAAAPRALVALDVNDDGLISPAERRAPSVQGQPARRSRGIGTFNLVFALDANHDGDLQWLEIANAVLSLKQLDLNGDGQLTPDELRPPMMAARSRV